MDFKFFGRKYMFYFPAVTSKFILKHCSLVVITEKNSFEENSVSYWFLGKRKREKKNDFLSFYLGQQTKNQKKKSRLSKIIEHIRYLTFQPFQLRSFSFMTL